MTDHAVRIVLETPEPKFRRETFIQSMDSEKFDEGATVGDYVADAVATLWNGTYLSHSIEEAAAERADDAWVFIYFDGQPIVQEAPADFGKDYCDETFFAQPQTQVVVSS
jgi:hypothetical protein